MLLRSEKGRPEAGDARNSVATFQPKPARLSEFCDVASRWLRDAFSGRLFPSQLEPGAAAILDRDVPIFYCSITQPTSTGLAPLSGRWSKAIFLLFPTSSLEHPRLIAKPRHRAVRHRLIHRGHLLLFACNTAKEAELLQGAGEAAIHVSHNVFVSNETFRPLAPRPPVYDALYNARYEPLKRHALTLEIERCAFIYYYTTPKMAAKGELERARHKAMAKGHVFLNRMNDGMAVRLTPEEVNQACNEAAVGLCLSAKEGAMLASMEYLLAGMPIVSTPSVGGRDVYFDDDYCIVTDADPCKIRDAVLALKQRNISREYIAARTMEKVGRDRSRLLSIVDDLRESAGYARHELDQWPYQHMRLDVWKPWAEFLRTVPSPAGLHPPDEGRTG